MQKCGSRAECEGHESTRDLLEARTTNKLYRILYPNFQLLGDQGNTRAKEQGKQKHKRGRELLNLDLQQIFELV